MSQLAAEVSADADALAADPGTGPSMLWHLGLRCVGSRALARALAANADLPRPLLWSLAPRRWDVRAAVAANPRCPRLLMRLMTWTDNWAISAALAGNPAASPRLLDYLARTSDPYVQLHVAGNPSVTAELADRLVADRDPYVRGVAAAHPMASPTALRSLAAGMREPAWILRRIAANPSCPADLSDTLLTWIALGGSGDADPTFDPVECTGHPGDTSVPVSAWYRERASRGGAVHHPLWQVRASALSAAGKLSGDQALGLARDPRPEVRRAIARAQRLAASTRRELSGDGDPLTARLARTAPRQPITWRSWQRLRQVLSLLLPAVTIAGLLAVIH